MRLLILLDFPVSQEWSFPAEAGSGRANNPGEEFGGIAGATWGCLAGALVGAVISQTIAFAYGLPVFLSIIARIGLAGAVMGAAVLVVAWPSGAVGLIGAIATGGVVYVGVLALVFPRQISRLAAIVARRGDSAV